MIICPQCKNYIIGYNSYFGSYFCNKCGYLGDGEVKEKENKLKLVQSSQCDIEFERSTNEVLWNYTMILKSKWEDTLGMNGNDYENDTFMVRSYDWGLDDEADKRNEYHFWHKPSGFKLQWYKYPLRDPYVNMDISHEQFLDILRDCMNSTHPNFTYAINEWWKDN